jgi:hypothetical protein
MLPSVAIPYLDTGSQMVPFLQAILSDLKTLFKRAYICPTLPFFFLTTAIPTEPKRIGGK